MASRDRIERLNGIKVMLGPVFEHRPGPDEILRQMAKDEQLLMLRVTNIGQPWILSSQSVTTSEGTTEYDLASAIGKVYYVTRTTGDTNIPYLSVPYDDFSDLNYGNMPSVSDVNRGLYVPEKIAFYRSNAQGQGQHIVLSPTPQGAMTYTIWHFPGAQDRTTIDMDSAGPIAELSDWLDMQSALALLPGAEWSESDDKNELERRNRSRGLEKQLEKWEPIVTTYLQNIAGQRSLDLGYWNDPD